MTREHIVLVHALCGVVIFLTGLAQLVLKKGGLRHRIVGQVYLYVWAILLASGAYLGGLLITLVGIFGFYFALTGSRIGKLKQRPLHRFDQGVILLAGLVMLAMLFYAIKLYLSGSYSYAMIFAVFGFLFFMTVQGDIRKYILLQPALYAKYGKMDWYFEHLNRMCISFIAAVTAFASIQNVFQNHTLNFLMPTFIGIVLIGWWRKKLENKLLPKTE